MRKTPSTQTDTNSQHRASRTRSRRAGGAARLDDAASPLNPALQVGPDGPLTVQQLRQQALVSAPLLKWLEREGNQRGRTLREVAAELGVTYGYLHQLRVGSRCTHNLSTELLRSIARFLRVPAILVRVVAGNIAMQDFAWQNQSEEELVDAALERMSADPVARSLMPVGLAELPLHARRALVLLWSEVSGADVLQAHRLPQALAYVQRCGLLHDEHLAELARADAVD